MESEGGPLLRARALAWLCLDPSTHADAVRWACVLCREFSLGGVGGIAGAIHLLGQTIPAAIGGEGALDTLLRSAEAGGAGPEARELRAWAHYFELESEWGPWQEIYVSAAEEVAAAGGDPAGGALTQLAQETLPLLNAAVDFLRQGPCPWLVTSPPDASMGPLPPPGEIAVVVGPDAGAESSEEVAAGEAYPSYTPDEQAAMASALVEALTAAMTSNPDQPALTFHAGPAPVEGSVRLPGLVSVAVDCGENEAAQSAAATVLAAAIKGALATPDGPSLGSFVVTNLSAAPAVSAALCRAVCFPSVALKAAALRQAVAYMGHAGGEGADVLGLAEGAAALFTPQEMAQLHEFEKATAGLQKRLQQGSGGAVHAGA